MGRARLNGQSGGGSNIKSIQSGTITFSGGEYTKTITIQSVDLNSAIIVASSKIDAINRSSADVKTKEKITSANSIVIERTNQAGTLIVHWRVVEFNNIKSLQKGDFSFSSSNSDVSININTINQSKSILLFSYKNSNHLLEGCGSVICLGRISSQNALIFNMYTGNYSSDLHWQVIEFK